MNLQTVQELGVAPGQLLHLASGGELKVIEGRVWLTRRGDLNDHLIEPGQRIRIRGSEAAIIETWRPTDTARVQWSPRPQNVLSLAVAEVLRGLAYLAGGAERGLRTAAGALDALARHAASSARRAQGCISAGDSIASSGALK